MQNKTPFVFPPRIIRFKYAPGYVGMDRNRFNELVRPELTVIPIGKQGIGFDRLEIDRWVDQYIRRNGRPSQPKGEMIWDEREYQDSPKEVKSGISTSRSEEDAFAKALERATSVKRKRT